MGPTGSEGDDPFTRGSEDSERWDRAQALLEEWAERRASGASLGLDDLIAANPSLALELRELGSACDEIELGFSEEAERARRSREALERLLRDVATPNAFSERYAVVSELGKGGMGAVYRIVDKKLARPLAMKVILGQASGLSTGQTPPVSPRQLTRFLNEARVTSQLDHPGIVPVHEVGVDDAGRAYFTMRLVQGRTLADVLELESGGDPEWTTARVLGLIQRVCEALAFAHERGVIHRDLKPANVMVGDFGEVYVMDWGLARRLDEAEEPSETGAAADAELTEQVTLTRDGHVLGTPSYMSPEQARGDIAGMGPRSDVYAVGAMLYQSMAGRPPYVREGERPSGAEVLARIAAGPPQPLHPRGQPPELVAICEKAMRFDPRERYADVRELAEDLERFLAGRAVKAFKTGAWVELRKWVQRNRALAASLAAAVIAITGGTAGYFAKRDVIAAGVETQKHERIEKELETGYGHLLVDDMRAQLPEAALEAFQRVLELDEGDLEAVAGAAVALLVQERYDDLVEFLNGHLEATRSIPSLEALRLEALRATGAALEVDPTAVAEPQGAAASMDRFVEGWRRELRAPTEGRSAYASAAEAFEEAIFLSPRARLFQYAALVGAAEEAEDQARAERAGRALLKLWPQSSNAWWFAGIAVARWDPEEALRRLLHASELEPDNGALLLSLGTVQFRAGDGAGAIETLRRSIELDPKISATHANLAAVLETLGRSEEAIAQCRVAIALDEKLSLAHYNLGRVLSGEGKLGEAIEAYRRAVELRPVDPDAHLNLGYCLLDVGAADEAVAEFRRAVDLAPRRSDARFNLGIALQQSEKIEEASECFTAACELDPDDFASWYQLAFCRSELHDAEGALEAARTARAKLRAGADPQIVQSIDELIAGGGTWPSPH